MAEQVRPPPTVRVVRPFASDKEFIEGDYAAIGKNTIILVHAQARPVGEIIRFEVVLSTGAPVFRGEGQVVAFHAPGGARPTGIEVRCARIDAKSKAILDQVHARRTTGSRTAPIPVSVRPPAPVSVRPAPAPAPMVAPPSPAVPVSVREAFIERPMERSGIRMSPARAKVAPPPNRDEILDRLRERARQLSARGVLPVKSTKQTA